MGTPGVLRKHLRTVCPADKRRSICPVVEGGSVDVVGFLELSGHVGVSVDCVPPGVLSHVLRDAPGQEARGTQQGLGEGAGWVDLSKAG